MYPFGGCKKGKCKKPWRVLKPDFLSAFSHLQGKGTLSANGNTCVSSARYVLLGTTVWSPHQCPRRLDPTSCRLWGEGSLALQHPSSGSVTSGLSLFRVKCALALNPVHHCPLTRTAEFKFSCATEKRSAVLGTELMNMPVHAQGS